MTWSSVTVAKLEVLLNLDSVIVLNQQSHILKEQRVINVLEGFLITVDFHFLVAVESRILDCVPWRNVILRAGEITLTEAVD